MRMVLSSTKERIPRGVEGGSKTGRTCVVFQNGNRSLNDLFTQIHIKERVAVYTAYI